MPSPHPAEAVLARFAAGSLPQKARASVSAHLETCEACRAAVSNEPERTVQRKLVGGDALIGQMLGEYRVLERIGHGGMGIVYRGDQPQIGKQVAIKVVLHEAADDAEAMQRMMDEARAVNAVRHPNIVDIFSLGRLPDGRPYVVMELLEGQSLQDLLKEKGFLTAAQVLDVLDQAMAALEAAHRVGVIHRDLKPANISVDAREGRLRVTLLDFGLALRESESTSRLTNPGLVVGTPAYMSPEQVQGLEVSSATDVYSMGVLAWTLLTGREPFSGHTAVDLMRHHLETPAPPLPADVDAPPALAELIARMLAKEPSARPTASEVRSEVRALAQGTSTVAAVVEAHRQTRSTVLVVAGAVVAVAVGAGFVFAITRSPDPLPPAAIEARPVPRPTPEVPRPVDPTPAVVPEPAPPPPRAWRPELTDPKARMWPCAEFTRTSDVLEAELQKSLGFLISFQNDKSLLVSERFMPATKRRVRAQLEQLRQQVERCRPSGAWIVATQSVGEIMWANKVPPGGKTVDAFWQGVVRTQPERVSIQLPPVHDAGR